MERLSPNTPYLSHVLLFCALSHVSPPQFRRELKKFDLQHTQNAVFYCDEAVLSPARRKLKSGNSYFFVTITTLQKKSKVVIPTLFPGNVTHCSARSRGSGDERGDSRPFDRADQAVTACDGVLTLGMSLEGDV